MESPVEKMAFGDEVDTTVTMLERRGGALDKKAVEIIKRLNAKPGGGGIGVAPSGGRGPRPPKPDHGIDWYEAHMESLKSYERKAKENDRMLKALKESKAEVERLELLVSMQKGDSVASLEAQVGAVAELEKMRREFNRMKQAFELPLIKADGQIDHDSVRGAFHELGEVTEKLARAMKRKVREEDTALLLAHEVANELSVLRCQVLIKEKIEEQKLKTEEEWRKQKLVDAPAWIGDDARPWADAKLYNGVPDGATAWFMPLPSVPDVATHVTIRKGSIVPLYSASRGCAIPDGAEVVDAPKDALDPSATYYVLL